MRFAYARPFFALASTLLLAATACDSSGETTTSGLLAGAGASAGTSVGGGGSASGGGSGDGGSGFTVSTTSGSGGGGGGPEVCDGVDNDGNGIIDDVDVGNDGICDCLLIATLGEPGQWGDGDVFATWLDDRSDMGATALGDAVLTPELLDSFQVIVAQDVSVIGRSYDQTEIDALHDWIEAGGGFMTLIGYADSTERTNVNLLLEPFGMAYDEAPILPKNGGNTIPITSWASHPITSGVSQVGVDNGYEVTGTGTVLATEQGHDLLLAHTPGAGHVAMWGDEWITYNSEWVDHPEYQVELLWLNTIKWLTPVEECQVDIPPPR